MENRELSPEEFYYCYDYRIFLFLKRRGLRYITKAINPKNGKKFTLFYRSPRFQRAMRELIDFKQEGYYL